MHLKKVTVTSLSKCFQVLGGNIVNKDFSSALELTVVKQDYRKCMWQNILNNQLQTWYTPENDPQNI